MDCGFGTGAGRTPAEDAKIAWTLRSFTEGATLASKELWRRWAA